MLLVNGPFSIGVTIGLSDSFFDLLNHFSDEDWLDEQADNPIASAIANAESVTFLIKEFLD